MKWFQENKNSIGYARKKLTKAGKNRDFGF